MHSDTWNHPTWSGLPLPSSPAHDAGHAGHDGHDGDDDDDVRDACNADGARDAREWWSPSHAPSWWLRSRFKRCDGGAPVVVVDGPVRGTRDARCGRACTLVSSSPSPFERARRGVWRNEVREQVE
jgi:hypothetical protein